MRQAERIRYLVLAAQREGNRQLAAALRTIGLTPEQAEVLRIVGDHDDLSIKGVGLMLVCDSGTNPSRLVERLVQSGLIERTSDPHDRRTSRLALTPEGRAKEHQTRVIEDALYAEIDTIPDGEHLVAILERLVDGQPSGEALKRRIG